MRSIKNLPLMKDAALVVLFFIACAVGFYAGQLDTQSLLMSLSMGVGIVSVTKMRESLRDLRRERGDLHAKNAALFEQSEELIAERKDIKAKETLTEEDTTRLAQIDHDLAQVESPYAANEQRIEELSAEIDGVENRMQRAEQLNERETRLAQPARGSDFGGGGNQIRAALADVRVVAPDAETRKHDLAVLVRCVALAGPVVERAPRIAREHFGNDRLACAMEAGSFAGGGFLVPETYVPDLIEYLRPASVIRRMGVAVPPLVNGSLTLPKVTGGASASYIGESENIPTSNLTGGQVKFTAKKLVAMVPMSNDLLRWSNPSADAIVRNDLVRAMAQAEDAAFIRNQGTGNAPKGLRYWADAARVLTMTATPDLAKVTNDLGRLKLAVENTDLALFAPYWLMAPRTRQYLEDLRDSNGNLAFPEIARGELRGYPFLTTTQIPTNLGTGGNESEVYFVESSELIIAEDSRIMLEASNVAAYHNGTSVVAAFSLDQTVVRVIAQHDFGPRHTEAIAVLTGVTWGASS